MTLRRVVYEIPGMTSARVRQVEYRVVDGAPLTMKVYEADSTRSRRPVVILLLGYSDVRAPEILGCLISEMESYVSWAQLLAASGMSAVTYVTGADPVEDTRALLEYVRGHESSLGIDSSALGILAFSGNVPNALSLLLSSEPVPIRCAALACGFMLDTDGNTGVADGAAKWGFVNPTAGRNVSDLRADVPMLIVRAGKDDNPGLNTGVDRFVCAALDLNLPLTLVNHATGPHAFEILEDSPTSRAIVRQVLAFFQTHLPHS
jgi:hypothetical protein